MRELLTAERLAGKIRMVRGHPERTFCSFLLVEGGTDEKFYGWYINKDKCEIIVTHGKEHALRALSLLEEDNFVGVLAIVDADFDVLEDKLPQTPNVLFTDTHDLETMILMSPALEKLLSVFGSEEKITVFEKRAGKEVRAVLIECGASIGYLRWVSLLHNLSLKFENLDFKKFWDEKTLKIDDLVLIKTVKNKSAKHALVEDEIQAKMAQLKSQLHDHWHVCCGHDLVCLLSLWLCKAIGTYNTKSVEPEMVEKLLQTTYERSHFCRTRLYGAIQEWEKVNQPFVVLHTE